MSKFSVEISERWGPSSGSCFQCISLTEDTPELIRIIRMLAGTTRLEDVRSGGKAQILKVNYIRPDVPISRPSRINDVLNYLFDDLPTEVELVELLRAVDPKNRAFYKDVREELSFLLLAMCGGRYTEAFLFLYRILEGISIACPLIYASRTTEFRGAHDLLSSFFNGGKSLGELALLQKFLDQYAHSNEIFRDNSIDINLVDVRGQFASELMRQFREVIAREVSSIKIDNDLGKITCPFKDVGSLIVTVRNRAFHNKQSQKNMSLAKLGGSEPLFKTLMPPFIHWLSNLFIEIARWQLSSRP